MNFKNMFNKPPMNKIFGNGEPAPNPVEKPMPSSAEDRSESAVENVKSSIAWKKFLTLFVLGVMSVESVEAASMSMTVEEKKDAVEYMKSSPELVKNYEQKVIEIAKTHEAADKGFVDGKHNTIKTFPIDAHTAVSIEYMDDEAITISVKDIDGNTSKILTDGAYGEKMDGRVDHITTTDSEGGKHKHGFYEKVNDKGDLVVQLTGISLSDGAASVAYYNAQKAMAEKLAEAAK